MVIGPPNLQPSGGTAFLGPPASANAIAQPAQQDPPRLLPFAVDTVDPSGWEFGAYRIVRLLGRGGMGAVYEAEHQQLEKRFAIKVISADAVTSAQARLRFISEFKALGALNHPNIVSAVDAGIVDGVEYFVTELLEGKDLADWVEHRGRPSIGAASEIVRQCALGLAHAHSRRLLHRDIKPSNVFLPLCGPVKLLDFGLVRDQQVESGMTATGMLMGTIDYMSPEQAESPNGCTATSDLYSLGASFHYLLCGLPPYPDSTHPNIASKLRGKISDPPWLKTQSQALPKELLGILLNLLEVDPKKRIRSANTLAERLAEWAEPNSLQAWIDGRDGIARLESMESAPTRRRGTRFGRWGLLAGGLTVGIIMASGSMLLNGLTESPARSATNGLSDSQVPMKTAASTPSAAHITDAESIRSKPLRSEVVDSRTRSAKAIHVGTSFSKEANSGSQGPKRD